MREQQTIPRISPMLRIEQLLYVISNAEGNYDLKKLLLSASYIRFFYEKLNSPSTNMEALSQITLAVWRLLQVCSITLCKRDVKAHARNQLVEKVKLPSQTFFSVSKYSSSRDLIGVVLSDDSSSSCSLFSFLQEKFNSNCEATWTPQVQEIHHTKRLKYLEFKTAKLSTYVWILSIDGLRTSW